MIERADAFGIDASVDGIAFKAIVHEVIDILLRL